MSIKQREYLDFELRLEERPESGEYVVEVRSAPIDGDYREVRPLPSDALNTEVHRYGTVRGAAATRKISVKAATEEPVTVDLKSLGHQLHDLLLPGRIDDCFRDSKRIAAEAGKGLRVVLRIDHNSPRLDVYPWECVHDGNVKYLALDLDSPLVRHVQLEQPRPSLAVAPPLKILGVIGHRDNLDVEGEQRRLEDIVAPLKARGLVDITWVNSGTRWDLQRALQGDQWHIFHFIGHGDFDGEAFICLRDANGEREDMSANELGIQLASSKLQLAVLNSCEGGRSSGDNYLSNIGSVLGQHEIPAVISMQNPITDDAAKEFSRMLYTCLLEDQSSIEVAVTEARKWIEKTDEWSTPVLHLRASGGRLFHVDLKGAIQGSQRRSASVEAPSAESPAVHRTPTPAPRDASGGLSAKNLQRLRTRIGNALPAEEPMLALELEEVQDYVDAWDDESVLELSAEKTIEDVFDDAGRSLLLLGDRGAGKSSLISRLQHQLYRVASEDLSKPLPVRVHLSSWTPAVPMVDWISDHVAPIINVPARMCRTCLDGGRFVPLFEGLHEIQSADLRAQCVDAINAFQDEISPSLLVSSQIREYIELPDDSRLTLDAAVRVLPYSLDKVTAYLEAEGAELEGLRLALAQTPDLFSDARTHYDLMTMITAYRGLAVEEIVTGPERTAAERKRDRLDHYTERRITEKLGNYA